MKSLHRLIAGAVLALLVGPLALVSPAHADEPTPDSPCATEQQRIEALEAEVLRWHDLHGEAIDRGWANASAAMTRALIAEDRVDVLTADVVARTSERDRAEARASRAARAIARLQTKVAELRARLRNEPVG